MRPVHFLAAIPTLLFSGMLLASTAIAESSVAGSWTGTYKCGGASAYTMSHVLEINMPGGDAFGGNTLSEMAQRMTSGEALDARFIKATGGRWNVNSGDLQ